MDVIYKYKLDTTDRQKIELPSPFQILCINVINNVPYIWIKHCAKPTPRNLHNVSFLTFGTGQEIDKHISKCCSYVQTYFLNNGSLEFHVFLFKNTMFEGQLI